MKFSRASLFGIWLLVAFTLLVGVAWLIRSDRSEVVLSTGMEVDRRVSNLDKQAHGPRLSLWSVPVNVDPF